MTIDEMMRLACIYAEQDRRGFLDAIRGSNTPSDIEARKDAETFVAKVVEYRKKKWGKTYGEKIIENCVPVPVRQINRGA